MAKESKSKLEILERQPDPEPPAYVAGAPPSLLLYASLLIFALILLVAAFSLKPADWAGFLINLSTEIVGAVIILILVERKFRSHELRLIRGLPATTFFVFSSWFSRESKELRAYAEIFSTQVKLASLPFYLSRPQIEAALAANRSDGLVLIGPPGIGKTTLLHYLIQLQAREVLNKPRVARVPVLVPAVQWSDDEAVEVLHTTMQSFYPISERLFKRLLKQGRLLCLFDGIDELLTPQTVVAKLNTFRRQHPRNPLIISSRPTGYEMFKELELERFEIPSLNEGDIQRLLKLRMGLSGD
jgi:predicted NACHT family NTPase